jgi:hypothetical protein
MSRKNEPSRRAVMQQWPWHVYTPTPTNGFGRMMGPMHAFCHATNLPGEEGVHAGYCTISTYAPGKPCGCLWCFRREADAIAFRAWCEENNIVAGDKPP